MSRGWACGSPIFPMAWLGVLVCALLGLLTSCKRVPSVQITIDERAVPGWVFVETRPECPTSVHPGRGIEWKVDEKGYGCTRDSFSEYLDVAVVLHDPKTGAERPYDRPLYKDGWVTTLVMPCTEGPREFAKIFIGSESELLRAPKMYDVLNNLGLRCTLLQAIPTESVP